jgi:serine/threonine-protein kinase
VLTDPDDAVQTEIQRKRPEASSTDQPSHAEIRVALRKILESPGFRNSERMRRFLSTIVEGTLAGDTDQLKEFSLGRDVFDRGEDYDPRTESIVRVEARRLRTKLAAYYMSEGKDSEVVIRLNPGHYVPAFKRINAEGPAHAAVATVAVMPFKNLSADPEQDYLCNGISEDIIDALSSIQGLRVLAHGSTFPLRDSACDPRAIGEKLGAGTLVEGSVRKNGGTLRVAARLIDTRSGVVRWSSTLNRSQAEIFPLVDEMARAIAALLGETASEEVKIPSAAPSIEAYGLYLRARDAANRADAAGCRAAIGYYTRAIEQFPHYTAYYSGLADVYSSMSSLGLGRPAVLMPVAKSAALEALRIDPGSARASASLAWILVCYDRNWEAGLKMSERAVRQEPGYAFGHMSRGAVLMTVGRFQEAVGQLEAALRLDPLSVRAHRLMAITLNILGRFEESSTRLNMARTIMPDAAELSLMLAVTQMAMGRFENALRCARDCQKIPGSPRMRGILAEALARCGARDEARGLLEEIQYAARGEFVDPWTFCRLHMALDDRDRAAEALAESLEARSSWAIFSPLDPLLKPLRNHPRFLRAIEELHLPWNPFETQS